MRVFQKAAECLCGVDASDDLRDDLRDQAASVEFVEFVESVDSLGLSLAR